MYVHFNKVGPPVEDDDFMGHCQIIQTIRSEVSHHSNRLKLFFKDVERNENSLHSNCISHIVCEG